MRDMTDATPDPEPQATGAELAELVNRDTADGAQVPDSSRGVTQDADAYAKAPKGMTR